MRQEDEISIADLRGFLSAAEGGSFTAAARAIGVTQPAASRQIQKLEQRLQTVLFDRTSRPLKLTTAGEQFLVYARDAVSAFTAAAAAVNAASSAISGELRIAASTAPGDYLLPAWVKAFGQTTPAARPIVLISDSAEVTREIRDGSWDVGFVGSPPHQPGLQATAVARDEVVLAVPSGHAFAGREEIDLSELDEQPFVVREQGSATMGLVEQTLRKQNLPMPKRQIVMTLNSSQASMLAIQKGLGLGWISILGFSDGAFPDVVPVRIRGVRFERHLYMILSGRRLPPVAAAFVQWIRNLPSTATR